VDFGVILGILSVMDNILQTRGERGLIDWCKNHRLALLHYLAGEFPSKRVKDVKLTSNGFPSSLGTPELVRASPLTLRLVLTLLYSTRALNLGRKPDFSPITAPYTGEPVVLPDVRPFFRELGIRPIQNAGKHLNWSGKYHMTTKAGPNGHALWTALSDLILLKDHKILEDIYYLGGPRLEQSMKTALRLMEYVPDWLKPLPVTLRKLSWFPDKELKVRIVAQLDYYSQTALQPLHHFLFKILRRIPQDCTFDQGKFVEATRSWKWYESLDLSAATDRFPIRVIEHVLLGIFPKQVVQSWRNIMISIPFKSDHGEKEYSVGNPMGAYSSWNSFTLAHHFILWWACRDLGLCWKSAPYRLLGDDIVIGSKDLAKRYKEIMSSLGVDISAVKSHSSDKLFEFAKRLFLDGQEITPFPLSSLPETSKKFYLLANTLKEEMRKGWTWVCGIDQSVGLFYTDIMQRSSSYSKKTEERAFITLVMMDFIKGRITADDLISQIIGRVRDLKEHKDQEAVQSLKGMDLDLSMYDLLMDKDPFGDEKGTFSDFGSLGLAFHLETLNLLETAGMRDQIDTLLDCIPLTSVYNEVLRDLVKESTDEVPFGSLSELMSAFKAFMFPRSDKVFTERETYTISRISSLFGEQLVKSLLDRVATISFMGPTARASLGATVW